MDLKLLVAEYLSALEAADLDRVLALFATDGIVVSPLYGTKRADEFYPALFADTAESKLTLKATMSGDASGQPVVAFWFDFDWILASGEPAPFSVVDVAELDVSGQIATLHIIYDTAPLREAFERTHSRSDSAVS